MPNYNKIILAGHLTRDVEIAMSKSNMAIGKTGIAVNNKYKEQEDVMFIDLTIFGKGAETLAQYTSKGSAVLIEGKIQLEQWEGKDGGKRSKHSIIVDNFQFLGDSKKGTNKCNNEEFGDIPF